MRNILFVATALAGGLIAQAAFAADMPYYGAEGGYSPAPAQDWTGLYLGAHIGAGFGSGDDVDPDGVLGGIQGGGNWQYGQAVVGVEGDFSGAGISDDFLANDFDVNWLATVRGRIGWAFDRFMVYGTGGFAWASAEYNGPGVSDDNVHMGWSAGVGVEGMVWNNISAKAEYLYMGLGEEGYGPIGDIDLNMHTFKVGVNYHF